MMALAPAGSAWVATADGLTLRLEPLDWPGCGAAAALEMWASGAYWVGAADWSLRDERHHACEVFAQGDPGLEHLARRTLHRVSLQLRLVRLEEHLGTALERLQAQDDGKPELLLQGFDREARAAVLQIARRCGGKVRRRRLCE